MCHAQGGSGMCPPRENSTWQSTCGGSYKTCLDALFGVIDIGSVAICVVVGILEEGDNGTSAIFLSEDPT
eukprot:5879892-Ditylum_brightwellii.AAC.1